MEAKEISKKEVVQEKKTSGIRRFFSRDQLTSQFFVLPGILWYIIFCYVPMYGI